MAKYAELELSINEVKLPLRIYKEWRSSVRISIGRKYATLRVPRYFVASQVKREIEKAFIWLQQQFSKSPQTLDRFRIKSYVSGDEIIVWGTCFTLDIKTLSKKTSTGKIEGSTIKLKLSDQLDEHSKSKTIKTLLSRCIGNHFLPQLSDMVDRINNEYFQELIAGIRLKYNRSNWGSCSAKRNLNFSTRLLFAAPDVIRYVVVHELAHLKEMNHSPRFWSWVAKADPQYKDKERWLKTNGHLCDF